MTGAVFLIAVAAITFPMLFDGAGIEPLELPPVEPAPVDMAVLEAVDETSPPPDSAGLLAGRDALHAEIDDDGYRRETGTRMGDPVLAEEGAVASAPADAWAVQVGSFSNHERALAMRDRLRDDGYDALLSSIKRSSMRMTRVAVGPMIERDAAVRMQRELGARYALEPRIVRFAL